MYIISYLVHFTNVFPIRLKMLYNFFLIFLINYGSMKQAQPQSVNSGQNYHLIVFAGDSISIPLIFMLL